MKNADGKAILNRADRKLKWLYCLALVSSVIPALSSGWVALAMGTVALFQLPLLIAYAYRVQMVVRHPATLDAFVSNWRLAALRKLGIGLMFLGAIGAFAMPFSSYLAVAIYGSTGPSGVASFVVGVWLAMASSAGFFGVVCFELSRLLGFETMLRPQVQGA
ncbi:MAG: hypothetical protein K9J42_08115 [Sulfuritalea sp.]|nr:hypothetical protein [Sulfuritalea sp.]